ncbi:MAG: hypothetical protein SFY56_16280 [Bacteroidota bacterium]|nr:hypothetical protein [Bacteroidota bacterium]
MRRYFKYTLLFNLLFCLGYSQVRIIKPVKTHSKTTNLSFGLGAARSVVFLNRNVKENNDANGLQASLIYGGGNLFRFGCEYTFYKPIDIAPTWYDIKAHTIEANVHIIARFKNTDAFFYPLFGLSYNTFSGYFTGKNDFLNLADKYKTNQIAVTNWVGLNVGTGYELFFKRMSLFLDYKMRVGFSDGKKQLNIMDVCFNAGLRYNLKVPSIYNLFKGTRNRYFLDK